MLDDETKKKIDEQLKNDRIVLYMKGTPQAPQCGFSAAVAQTLSTHGKPFKTYDILEDEALRQGIKEYSNWPTIPQIYIDGKFIGGCDIVMDLEKKGDLAKLL